jgi:hypothetical protein
VIAIPIVLGAVALVLMTMIDAGIVLAIVALIVLVVIPGLALTSRLVPSTGLGGASWAALALGLGLGGAMIVGIAADLTPLGIRFAPIILLAISIAWIVVLYRGSGRAWLQRMPRARVSTRDASLLALGLVLAVSAYGIARGAAVTAAAGTGDPSALTQLWILPMPDDTVQLGIHNGGDEAMTYRLVLGSDDAELGEFPEIVLEPGTSWQETVPAASIPEGGVEARLYDAADPSTPIRTVSISDPPSGG